MCPKRLIGSILNCGFARVAIHTLSRPTDKVKRRKEFFEMFKSPKGYIDDMAYFDEGDGQHDTKFDRGCQKIMERFQMKWHPNESRHEYLSVKAWRGLSLQSKSMHTLSDCQGCLSAHATLQARTRHTQSPLTLVMSTPSTSQGLLPTDRVADKHDAQEITRKALSSINNASIQALGIPFLEAIVQYCPEEQLMAKPCAAEKKKVQRSVMRVCKTHLEKQMRENDALNSLREPIDQ